MVTRFLISGCGGDIGISIARILRDAHDGVILIGTDIHSDHPGSQIFDACYELAPAHDHRYISQLRALIREHDVTYVFPTSEAEQGVLLHVGATRQLGGVEVILPNRKALEIGLDKLRTFEFLLEHALPRPWTVPVMEGDPLELPCLVKPRIGQGGKGILVVEQHDLDTYRTRRPDYIWQELLGPPEEEYTCGLFRSEGDETRALSFRRRLMGGLTGSGVVVSSPEIDRLLKTLAGSMDLRGSVNVQLFLTERGPVVFEINARFSSTVMFRHKLGFQDVVWALQDRRGVHLDAYSPPRSGTRIYRGAHEYIVPPEA